MRSLAPALLALALAPAASGAVETPNARADAPAARGEAPVRGATGDGDPVTAGERVRETPIPLAGALAAGGGQVPDGERVELWPIPLAWEAARAALR